MGRLVAGWRIKDVAFQRGLREVSAGMSTRGCLEWKPGIPVSRDPWNVVGGGDSSGDGGEAFLEEAASLVDAVG